MAPQELTQLTGLLKKMYIYTLYEDIYAETINWYDLCENEDGDGESKKAIGIAVSNNKMQKKITLLASRLRKVINII